MNGKSFKKTILGTVLLLSIVGCSIGAYAKVKNYTYKYNNNVTMEYNLVGAKKGAGALTIANVRGSDSLYYSYLAMFSYDKKGRAKKSWCNEKLSYISHTMTDKKAKSFMSVHSLKNENMKPIGITKKLYK